MPFRFSVLLLLTVLGMVPVASDWLGTGTRAAAAVEFEEVAPFELPPQHPASRLLYVASDGNYYGTAPEGGATGHGAIFRLTPGGASSTVVSFTDEGGSFKGAYPIGALVLGADGALYGATTAGGSEDCGTIFKVTTAGVFTTLVQFNDTTIKGTGPNGLTLAGDGNFYGTTQGGGMSGEGTLFRLTPAGALTTLVEFTGSNLSLLNLGAKHGGAPVGTLVATGTSSITLYGVTQTGGSLAGLGLLDDGTVFRYAVSTNTFTMMATFTGDSALLELLGGRAGRYPNGGLCLHSNGYLYGTTEFGGASDVGTIFKIKPDGTNFATIKQFDQTTGANPAGTLVEISGTLYGTTRTGGNDSNYDDGTIYRITSDNHQRLVNFTGRGGVVPGSEPTGGMIVTPGGDLLGTTSSGGIGNLGTCFKFTTGGTFTNFLHFSTAAGWSPAGGPALDDTGAMLVPLNEGGAAGFGTLRRVQTNGVTTVETAFLSPLNGEPAGGLLKVGADYYGLLDSGGANDAGAFYRYTPGFGATLLASCSSSTGDTPEGPPVLGPDGYFYTVARKHGGGSMKGSILRLGTDGSIQKIATFAGGTTQGAEPRGPLAVGADGNLYGVTQTGGANNVGTAFKVTTSGVLTTLSSFGLSPLPNQPHAGLVAGADGNFYGTTSSGTLSNAGAVIKVSPLGVVTTFANFTDGSGAYPGSEPSGPLTVALDGTLYGITAHGGSDDKGTIFRISPSGSFTSLTSLRGSDSSGESSGLGLTFAPDGYLYGTSASGGTLGGGHVFRLKKLGPHAATDEPIFGPGIITFQGRAQTGGENTTVSFEYGVLPLLGQSTTPAVAGASNSPASFSTQVSTSGITPGSTIFYRAIATNPSGTSIGLTRSYLVPAPMSGWALGCFGTTSVSDSADPDCDGLPNLVEYALLTSPIVCESGYAPSPVVRTYAEGARLSLTIQRDPARNDITLEVLTASSPGGPWTAVATSTLGAPFVGPGYVSGDSLLAGIKTVEIRDTVNIADAPSRFLRIRVTH